MTDERYKLLENGVTCVANLKTDKQLIAWAEDRGLDEYIGRANGRFRRSASKWANPFRGENAIELFQEYLATRRDLLEQIGDLKGKLLLCYCHPEPCHGDVLAKLANEHGGQS